MTMTRLERNAQLHNVLRAMERAYEKGDFTEFVALLDEDCVYESMWVIERLHGREAVANHLLGKGNSISKSGSYPDCWIEEMVGNINPLPDTDIQENIKEKYAAVAPLYEAGKYCLIMEQKLDGETNEVVVVLQLKEDGKVSRISICLPEYFNTRSCCPYVDVFPGKGEDNNRDARVIVGDAYYSELYLFFDLAGEEFDEYDNLEIPMEKWEYILSCWKDFVDAPNYDAFVEKVAGIDYENWFVGDKDVLSRLGYSGVSLWKERKENARMLNDLMEWTKKYKNSYECICTYGF